ncbi:hypothetical protein ACJIZ3_005182 [Penstemon smallii]|uniref:Uncharacterized protein n=1 Tax=Penstemon smallii TaxID=265156 RepID=A0ABD3S4C6_9LAMI
MDYQQTHSYMRLPPPPPPPPPPAPPAAADPYQRPPPPPLPPPQWTYPTTQHFQFQPQSQQSPSPPINQYPAHHPPPYPPHPHYPPSHQIPPRPPHVPQHYSQDWGSGSWNHHQSWEYPMNSNGEDWAAKAKAWAAAKSATDNQHTQSQFIPVDRPEDQNHRNQYSQSTDPQYNDVHIPLAPSSSYQQYPVGMGSHSSGLGQLQDSHYISSRQFSYAADMHVPYAARDGSWAGDSTAPFPQQEKSSITPLVHQQEVPSSYSSVAGNESIDRYEKFNSSSSLPVASTPQHHVQPLPAAGGRYGWMEEPHHLLGSRQAETVNDPSDRPLNFAPHFNRHLDPHVQPNYTYSSVRDVDPVAISSNYTWGGPSSAPGAVYPPLPPKISSGPQVDHTIAMPSPTSGHSTSTFHNGPGFPPTHSMIGAAFGVGTGVTPNSTAFSVDPYGVPSVSERPKKASVPNWLREEIIKNKAVITSSALELPKEHSQSLEEDSYDKSPGKGDQADSRSIESSRSRSTEDENEDEDEVEAARTAAINQEIKRVLTEVLLKVTDELFDEIATKVLKEDNVSVEDKTSAKVLIQTQAKEVDDVSEKSTSGSPGNILGLANYASDGEDAEVQSSNKLNSKENSTDLRSSKDLENHAVTQNGGSREVTELNADGTASKIQVLANAELNDNREARELVSSDNRLSSKRPPLITEDKLHHGSDRSKSNKSVIEKVADRNERPGGSLDSIRSTNDDTQSRHRSDRNDGHENRKSLVGKDYKDSESAKKRVDNKGVEESRRHGKAESTYNHNGSKDKGKEKGRSGEKAKDSESRNRLSSSDGKEETSKRGREKRKDGKEDGEEKRQDNTGNEKKERSRRSDSSRRKRRRSPSASSRGRETKDNHAHDYSDESSDDSRRKSRQSKRHKSPSPIRTRKRQTSRSPHSKHRSKRRHSPYSSLETSRKKRTLSRSRSRSPVHRRR